jgi:hypothetical protein
MKKFTILIALILISIGTSYGQGANGIEGSRFSAGRWYLGGSFIATSQTEKHEDSSGSSDGPKNSTFKLVPKAGYIINDKISVGLAAGYKLSSVKTLEFDSESNEVELKDKEGTFIVGPSVSYFVPFTDDFICMMSLFFGFGFGNATDEYLGFNPDTNMDEVMSEEWKVNSFRTGIRPSFKYFLNDYWALSLGYGSLFYESSTQTSKEDSDLKWSESEYGIDLSTRSISIGAWWFF